MDKTCWNKYAITLRVFFFFIMDTPHECKLCNYTATTASHVRKHEISVHKKKTNTFPLEIWIYLIKQYDLRRDWEAILACWGVDELRVIIRHIFKTWRISIIAYQYESNNYIELGIQFKSRNHCYVVNLASNRINNSFPLVCRELSKELLGKMIINEIKSLSINSLISLKELFLVEGYITVQNFPEKPGDIIILLYDCRMPAFVGIHVESVDNGILTVAVLKQNAEEFRRLNNLRFHDNNCNAYHIHSFSSLVSIDNVMNVWLSRHKNFLKKSQEQRRFGDSANNSTNYAKRSVTEY